ncbi:WD40 repeat domain-containing protein [Desulfobotulus sp. H1]|uniref:WD40 repeat domain-containing protein n=1 Tax=Desulfobotulus pelophilus TaxID=2823377 RepID=A0ABT3N847_9BACT|nr:WD40 repeat domain-containing protein [Desulfobotulus pelophilus]MCW7753629.1 WD40 repeat domain-containing protein [Desulfobotulus pelophilus]
MMQNAISQAAWDWQTGRRIVADLDQWKKEYGYVEEPFMRPDGEEAAAIVRTDEAEYSVICGTELWEGRWDKIWKPGYGTDGRFSCLVSELGAWSVAVDDRVWDESFDFLWTPLQSRDGTRIGAAVQQGRQYAAVLDGNMWEKTFFAINDLAMASAGDQLAAVVQTVALQEGDIEKFQSGCFTVAVNGEAWNQNFVNLWDVRFSEDGRRVAAAARSTLYDYTVVVDGKSWKQRFDGVWEPLFLKDGRIAVPARSGGKWRLCVDGEPLWAESFVQLWQLVVSDAGGKIAGVCAPEFGKWTLVEDGKVWSQRFGEMVMDPVFSPDGRRLACTGKNGDMWTIACDDKVWDQRFDQIWAPVFSPDGNHVGCRARDKGRFGVYVNGKTMVSGLAFAWDPVFSPDGQRVLIRGVGSEGDLAGKIFREVLEIG